MSFVSFPHLVYIVYQIFWEKSNFWVRKCGLKFAKKQNLGKMEIFGRWRKTAVRLVYPKIVVIYRLTILSYTLSYEALQ